MKEKFDVMGMTCASCQAHVDKSVRKVDGVKDCNVNLLSENMEVEFYKCEKCGNVIELINGDESHITCCGEKMTKLKANTVDAAAEKHVPFYEVDGDIMEVRVGEVMHPMEENHYICGQR